MGSGAFAVAPAFFGSARRIAEGVAAVWLLSATIALADDGYRFRAQRPAAVPAAPATAAAVLTPEERAFVAGLGTVRVAIPQPPAAPYEVIEGNEVSGIHADMLAAIAGTFGLRLRPVVLPTWSAALEALKNHEADVLMTIGVTAERLKFLDFTLGATPLPGALFARPGTDTADLSRLRFALERNYLANTFVGREFPQAPVTTVETTEDALREVAAGRADVYLGSLLEASDVIVRKRIAGVQTQRLLNYGGGHYHFAVRNDWPLLTRVLNKGIATLRDASAGAVEAAAVGLPGHAPQRPMALSPAESAALAMHSVWRLGAVRGLALLNDIDERGRHAGIAADYAEQVAQRLGVALQVVPFDSVAAMLDGLRAGRIDLVPFLTRTPERAREFVYSKPYVEMPYVLVARTDAPLYWGLESLAGRQLALAPQHPLRPTLAERYPQIRLVEAASGDEAMSMVARGVADAAVEVKLFANRRINGDAAGTLRAIGEVRDLPAQFAFAAAPHAAALVPLVDRALENISEAERARLLGRWVAVDLPPVFQWRRYLPLLAVTLGAVVLLGLGTFVWMRRLSKEVAARRRTEMLLDDIAHTVPGIAFRYIVAADGRLIHNYFTPNARAFLGIDLDPKRTVLAAAARRLRPDEFEAAMAAQREAMRTGAPFKFTAAYAHPDGREVWMQAEAVVSRRTAETVVWTGYIVDVSAERELQRQVAEEARSRTLMLASASHELRAPTHTLSLAIQAVQREGLSERQRSELEVADGAARMLTQLLDDVLDAAQLDHRALRLRPQVVALRTLFDEVGATCSVAARERGLAFRLFVGDEVPTVASLDPLRLKQVLTNLLSNACKYTPAGAVVLDAGLDTAGRLRIAVSDTGIGIDDALRARVFEPFTTLADGLAPREGRSGLGLSICARIVALMGGTIGLERGVAAGTVATVSIPLARPADLPRRAQGHRVLVCDDDITSLALVAHMLRRLHYDVTESTDGQEALAQWRRGGTAALVCDLDMPGLSGTELIRCVRAEEPERRTVIVVCSGELVPAACDGGSPPACDAFLAKPVRIETLAETLLSLGVPPRRPAGGGAEAGEVVA